MSRMGFGSSGSRKPSARAESRDPYAEEDEAPPKKRVDPFDAVKVSALLCTLHLLE